MSDLIDRQQAIDALHVWFSIYMITEKDMSDHAQDLELIINHIIGLQKVALRKLPSAQPEERTEERTEECTETHACDLISRHDAIKVCNSAIDLWRGQLGSGALTAVRNAIKELPSAQPKRGKWIQLGNSSHNYICSLCGRMLAGVTDGKNNVAKEYPFCHCGADMRGEQDEKEGE